MNYFGVERRVKVVDKASPLTESKRYTLGRNIFGDITGTAILSGNSLEHLSKFVTIISKDLI